MIEVAVSACALLGATFMLLAAVGVFRLPDLPSRMHASTKAGTLGTMLVMVGASLHFAEAFVTARAAAIVLFILITAPIGSHVIGRAAYFLGVPLWSGTVKDELKGHYDNKAHTLDSCD